MFIKKCIFMTFNWNLFCLFFAEAIEGHGKISFISVMTNTVLYLHM